MCIRDRFFLDWYPDDDFLAERQEIKDRQFRLRNSQSKIEDFAQFAKLNDICPSYSSAKLLKILQTKHIYNKIKRTTI